MNDIEMQKQIPALLKELQDIVLNYAKVKVATEYKMAEENVIEGAKKLKETCINTAKEFRVDLENASQKYDDSRNGVRQIVEKYKDSAGKLRKEYNARSKAIVKEITEAEAERAGWLKNISDVDENRKNVIRAEKEAEPIKTKKTELNKAKKAWIKAMKTNNFDEAAEYVTKCTELKKEIKEMEKAYDKKLVQFDETLEKAQNEYDKVDEKVEKLKALSKQMKKDFEKECKEAAEVKKQELALVKGNKFIDKIRGFFSKGIIKSINGQKKFKEQFLIPTTIAMNLYANQVPGMMRETREKFETKVKEITGKSKEALWIAKEATVEAILAARDKTVDIAKGTKDAVVHGATVVKDTTINVAKGTKDAVVHGATVVKDATINVATGTKNVAVKGATVVKDAAKSVAIGTKDVAVSVASGIVHGAISINDQIKGAYRAGAEKVNNKVNEMKIGLADGIINATDVIREKTEKLKNEYENSNKKTYEIGEME